MEPIESEEEYEEKRSELINKAQDVKQDLEQEQQEILEEVQSEHGGELVETKATIAGDYTVTVKTKLNGEFINRLSAVDEQIKQAQEEQSLRDIENTMDQAATILADITEETEYSKELFYSIYEMEGPKAMGKIIESVFESLGDEQERKAGAVDGFRKK